MERESRETWAKRVEHWKDSGLTAKEYAAETGLKAPSLSWWKWRLASTATATTRATVRTARRTRRPEAPPPVTLVELPSATAAEPFEVLLSSSLRVRVPSTFDAGALRRLLDVLGARP